MSIFILKRLGLAIITLAILSVIVFFAAQVLPGDPARAILGPLAAPSAVKALSHELGTDKSIFSQYGTWIGHIVRGNFGESYQYRVPVGSLLGPSRISSIVPSVPTRSTVPRGSRWWNEEFGQILPCPGASLAAASADPIITASAPQAMAFAMSPPFDIPPSAITCT